MTLCRLRRMRRVAPLRGPRSLRMELPQARLQFLAALAARTCSALQVLQLDSRLRNLSLVKSLRNNPPLRRPPCLVRALRPARQRPHPQLHLPTCLEPHRLRSRRPMPRLKTRSNPAIFSRVSPPRHRTPSSRLKRRVRMRQNQPSLLPPRALSSSPLRPPMALRCFRRVRVLLLPVLVVVDCLARNPVWVLHDLRPREIYLHPSPMLLKPRLLASLSNKSNRHLLRIHSVVCFPPNLQPIRPSKQSPPRLLRRCLRPHRLRVRPSHLALFNNLPLYSSRLQLPRTGSIPMLLSQLSVWRP